MLSSECKETLYSNEEEFRNKVSQIRENFIKYADSYFSIKLSNEDAKNIFNNCHQLINWRIYGIKNSNEISFLTDNIKKEIPISNVFKNLSISNTAFEYIDLIHHLLSHHI